MLSLNIHESLTFPCEICLHPDIVLGESAPSDATHLHSCTEGKQSNRSLKSGDLVEIHVWDARPGANAERLRTNSMRSALPLRKSPSTPPRIKSSASVQSSSSESYQTTTTSQKTPQAGTEMNSKSITDPIENQINKNGKPIDESKQDPSNSSNDLGASKDLSMGSPPPVAPLTNIPFSPSAGMESGESLPTKLVASKPPVFPRSKITASENILGRSSGQKPPVQRRSASSDHALPEKPASLANSHTRPSRHMRDFSDITMDTAYGNNTALLPSSKLIGELQVPNAPSNVTSEDDDDHDVLESSYALRLSFLIQVGETSLTSLKGNSRCQISLLRKVADLYSLSSFDLVTVSLVDPMDRQKIESVSASFVLVTIKDQFVSRGDMHAFQESLIGSWIYEGQRLHENVRGVQAYAQEIQNDDSPAKSGIVTSATTVTFRSRSARFIWLIQMSSEMWEYASPFNRNISETSCHIYFDKLVALLHKLFDKWKSLESSHSLTVVFFSRTFLGTGSSRALSTSGGVERRQKDVYGRPYEDHYRIVLENCVSSDWDTLISKIKTVFASIPLQLGWNTHGGSKARRPSSAPQGNVLEAINVTLNLLQYHYLDRDLRRTGNSLVVVSAGGGIFEVDKHLAGMTYQRMMDNGIGSDVISLGLPPLHIAPFFLYVNHYQRNGQDDHDDSESYYEIPHWMNLSFYNYDDDTDKEEAKPVPSNEMIHPMGFRIRANGFLCVGNRAQGENEASQGQSSPQLSPVNANLSPRRKLKANEDRQLIADRQFPDILEACRPRNLNVLPSALLSLLEMRRQSHGDSWNEQLKFVRTELTLPTEWGSIDNESPPSTGLQPTKGSSPSIQSQGQLSSSPRGLLSFSPPSKSDHDDSSLHSSSFASQVSSYLLGSSLERDRNFTPLRPGIMQRSPSLEMLDISEEQEPDAFHLSQGDENDLFLRRAREAMTKISNEIACDEPASDELVLPKLRPSGVLRSTKSEGRIQKPVSEVSNRRARLEQSGGLDAAIRQYHARDKSLKEQGAPAISRLSSFNFRSTSDQSTHLIPPSGSQPLQVRRSDIRIKTVADIGRGSPGPLMSRSPGARFVISSSPPNISRIHNSHQRQHSRPGLSYTSKRKKAFNPFRQRDEEAVLALKSHNRRRWSHVFSAGEIEFRRRTGPNWKSLTAPAILPLTVGYFPTKKEIDHAFSTSFHSVAAGDGDPPLFSSGKELFLELVRQRLTQDYQLVPRNHVDHQTVASILLGHDIGDGQGEYQFLSMGHRLQVLACTTDVNNPENDGVEIHTYSIKLQSTPLTYSYYSFCEELGTFKPMVQTFQKYGSEFTYWSKYDNIIAGSSHREMNDDMRFRSIMFALVPDNNEIESLASEAAYVTKFQRLLEYFEKLRERGENPKTSKLEIKLVTSEDRSVDENMTSKPGIGNSMTRFNVDLQKRKSDPTEWMEYVIDSTFNTHWSYRIMLNWLVASSGKVDTQIQLLQRRCSQYGLSLVPYPQISVSKNLFLNPLKAPALFRLPPEMSEKTFLEKLVEMNFAHDGVFCTDMESLQHTCSNGVIFPKRLANGRQLVHRSGCLFLRIITIANDFSLVVTFGNYRLKERDQGLNKARELSKLLCRHLRQLN